MIRSRDVIVLLSISLLLSTANVTVTGQAPVQYTSGQIYEAIKGLNVLGSVLYVAAHPDDENTRLISYLANEKNMYTTYLSMTRGDGGQNLIGPEISELLGVIRTQELLQARRTDHGHQRFTRANDFGFSKTPEETLKIWDEQEILSDVVWAIRSLQPDVIIDRFMTESLNGNHGHHTSSAILAVEAFDKAGDPNAFPEQLKWVKVWKPERQFLNTSWWFYGSREKFDEIDKSNMAIVNVGGFDPITGVSNGEIAARSRTMHKSQGFGSTGSRGDENEYLDLLKGSKPTKQNDIFSGINTTWSRLAGGAHIAPMVDGVAQQFDFQHPEQSIPALLRVRKEIQNLGNSIWKTRKLDDIDQIIAMAMGLYAEADADSYLAAAGDSVLVSLELTNRAGVPMQLKHAMLSPADQDLDWSGDVAVNTRMTAARKIKIPEGHRTTTPYWLNQPFSIGRYTVDDQLLRGLPETPRDIAVDFTFVLFGDAAFTYSVPVVYKETDPVKGEVYRPFEVVPPVFVNIQAPVYIFTQNEQRQVDVVVRSSTSNVSGTLQLQTPKGWSVEPSSQQVNFNKSGEETHYVFSLTPESGAEDGLISAEVMTEDGILCDQMITEINYDHIPAQTVLRHADAKVVHIDLKLQGQRIAYIAGAGDDVAANLQRIGYTVDLLAPADVTSKEMLKRYDAVILGIRAYNTQDRLPFVQDILFDYVSDGGTLITQYNTTSGLVTDRYAPYAMKISRKRVTDEGASVKFLEPEHPALNYPNKLTQADFDGWVQERGLYFAEDWGPELHPLLSMADPGEDQNAGSLLVGQYGDGYFVYTSLSFFRQLPDGVTGAYRLFANLIALGRNGKS